MPATATRKKSAKKGFTDQELDILSQYVTSTTGNVFAIRDLNGIVGAIFARYSRAKGGFRETMIKEFVQSDAAGVIDKSHAQDLIERVLIAYGDDSVGELEGGHVAFEDISGMAEKAITDHRIGGAFIVQSTRYVYFNKKVNGKYRYYREPRIMASELGPEYERVMDSCYDTYADLLKPLIKYYRTQKPREKATYDILGDGKKQRLDQLTTKADQKAFIRTYRTDIKTKACDTIRFLLPIALTSNMGVYGNGRFYQGMISSFYSSELSEIQQLGTDTHNALNHVIPRYVKRAQKLDYRITTERAMRTLATGLLSGITPDYAPEVDLQDWTTTPEQFDVNTTAAMLYEYSNLPLRQLKQIVTNLPEAAITKIRNTYMGDREARRDRPGRALEDGYPHTFDMLVPFHVFKDLQRHRMSTQLWQHFTPKLGFNIPDEIHALVDTGLAPDALERTVHLESSVRDLHDKLLAKGLTQEAQYVTLYGHNVRWLIGLNDRALMHLTELRTGKQGHPEYRRIAGVMQRELAKRFPWRAKAMKFVDHNEYGWARADSEAKQRVKERELEPLAGH